jgi:CubicO group peptidase (beta-lactamase class C family)
MLRDEGWFDLDQHVVEILPVPAFRHITLRNCLTHTAGFYPGISYFREVNTINEVLQRVSLGEFMYASGARRVYSDLSFITLGKIVELVSGDSLDSFCHRRIFAPLGMTHTCFRPPAEWAANCAATENCEWRGRVMCGSVHDETSWAMGGVAGHAGLFSCAQDLATFCRALYERRLLPEKTIAEILTLGHVPFYPWQSLGWKVDPWSCGSEGFLPSRTAIGHTGWTGTSIWLDLKTGVYSILLGNTCHPSRESRNNPAFRRTFYTPLAKTFFQTSTNTHTGVDRLC